MTDTTPQDALAPEYTDPWVILPAGFPNVMKTSSTFFYENLSYLTTTNESPPDPTPIPSGVKKMHMRIERVTALPATLSPSTMYVVKSADAALAEVYFSNNDGTEARHVINKSDIQGMITGAVSDFTNIQVAADIAARNAMSPTRNVMVLALDATADTTVTSGSALYLYDVGTTTWHKVSEFESLDVVLEWDAIQGRPTSTVAAIDDAVLKAHTHANKTQLDKVGEGADGVFQYDGKYIEANVAVNDW